MNAERLLAHYERIADAPDAVLASAPFHSRPGRARQAGGTGPERRTGVGIVEANRGGKGERKSGLKAWLSDQSDQLGGCSLEKTGMPFRYATGPADLGLGQRTARTILGIYSR